MNIIFKRPVDTVKSIILENFDKREFKIGYTSNGDRLVRHTVPILSPCIEEFVKTFYVYNVINYPLINKRDDHHLKQKTDDEIKEDTSKYLEEHDNTIFSHVFCFNRADKGLRHILIKIKILNIDTNTLVGDLHLFYKRLKLGLCQEFYNDYNFDYAKIIGVLGHNKRMREKIQNNVTAVTLDDFHKKAEEIVRNNFPVFNYEKLYKLLGTRSKLDFRTDEINRNPNYFDYIALDIGLCGIYKKSQSEKLQIIKQNIKEINMYILDSVSKDRSFKKYDVPIEFLKITNVTLRNDDRLHFVLELKESEE